MSSISAKVDSCPTKSDFLRQTGLLIKAVPVQGGSGSIRFWFQTGSQKLHIYTTGLADPAFHPSKPSLWARGVEGKKKETPSRVEIKIMIFYVKISLKLDFDRKFGISASKYVVLNHSGPILKNVEKCRKTNHC